MSDSVKIVMAQVSDLDGILEIEDLSFNSDKFSRRQFQYLLLKAKSGFFVIKDSNKILANLIILTRSNSRKLRIYSIAVHPDSRGKGLAHKLIEKAISFAKENKCSQLHLEVRKDNQPAISLYEKEGFRNTGLKSRFYSDGCDAIVMTKKI
jgi:[ribosomal protein S18]-alanine N-acetyltransferase